jgi:membrane-associated phospholipid phosphatase
VKRARPFALAALALLVWFAAYQAVGSYASTLQTHDPSTPLDRVIPFVPSAAWVYESCYALPFVVVACAPDTHTLRAIAVAAVVTNLVAFACFILFPVAFPQPPLGDSLAERMLALERAWEFVPGANNAPSLHVALPAVAWLRLRSSLRARPAAGARASVPLGAWTIAIAVSTLLVKQHVVVDVVSGFALAVAVHGSLGRAGAASPRIPALRRP